MGQDVNVTFTKIYPGGEITVSIIILSYNHERYIRQTIESVLMQKVNFFYEILVGDDASSDATPQILKEYSQNYPGLFRIFLREKNLGATRNSYEMLSFAKGKYIANLDGDDLWTDENKLQIQVDFLENHPEYIACSHRESLVDEYGRPTSLKRPFFVSNKKVFTLRDFKGKYLPGGTSSLVKRNIFLRPEHDYSILYKAHPMISDLTSAMIFLSHGNFYRIDRTMGCYRRVLQKGGGNIHSLYIAKVEHIYDDYSYASKLCEYAKNVLHIDAGLDGRKKMIFANAVCSFMTRPNGVNYKVMTAIYREERRPVSYILYLPVAILKKIWMKLILSCHRD